MSIPHYWSDAIHHLSTRDTVIAKIISAYAHEALTSRSDAFYTLCRSIVGQQISVKAADSIWKKLETGVQDLTYETVWKADEAQLRAYGLSGSKIKYMKFLAEYFSHTGHKKDWKTLSVEEVSAELLAIKGIGKWTVQMFLIFHQLHPDQLPLGDIGLMKAIEKSYNEGKPLSTTRLGLITKKWAPYRTVATWYLWRSLDPVPVKY